MLVLRFSRSVGPTATLTPSTVTVSTVAVSMPDEPEYTIDELAAITRVPGRTIRFYQARGVLMPPVIRGRVAYYGAAHRERLERIAQLQDRGLRIAAIRDLMGSIDRGDVGLAEWLGVEREVAASWADDRPRTVTVAELYELAGSRRPGLLADLARSGLVTRRGEVYLLHSPALLAVAMKLEAADIDLDTAAGAARIVRKHVAKLADELVEYQVKRVRDGFDRHRRPRPHVPGAAPRRHRGRARAVRPRDGAIAARPPGLGQARRAAGPSQQARQDHSYEEGDPMTDDARERLAHLRGALRLLGAGIEAGTDIVEDMHRTLAAAPLAALSRLPATRNASRLHDGVRRGVYGWIRGVSRVIFGAIDATLAHAGPALALPVAIPGPLVGVLHGILGDGLERDENPLRIAMHLRHAGQRVPVTAAALADVIPASCERLVVFVHGLACDESSWEHASVRAWGRPGVSYASLLRAQGLGTLHLRYNSGLRVDANGRMLSALLGELLAVRPVRELVLIGHSMGGLVVRSACHHGSRAGVGRARTRGRVHRLTARRGRARAAGALATGAADRDPGDRRDRPRRRSSQRGHQGPAPTASSSTDPAGEVPLPHARYHFIAGSYGKTARTRALGWALGDGLVRVASASHLRGRHGRVRRVAPRAACITCTCSITRRSSRDRGGPARAGRHADSRSARVGDGSRAPCPAPCFSAVTFEHDAAQEHRHSPRTDDHLDDVTQPHDPPVACERPILEHVVAALAGREGAVGDCVGAVVRVHDAVGPEGRLSGPPLDGVAEQLRRKRADVRELERRRVALPHDRGAVGEQRLAATLDLGDRIGGLAEHRREALVEDDRDRAGLGGHAPRLGPCDRDHKPPGAPATACARPNTCSGRAGGQLGPEALEQLGGGAHRQAGALVLVLLRQHLAVLVQRRGHGVLAVRHEQLGLGQGRARPPR